MSIECVLILLLPIQQNYRVKVADLGEARRISALSQYEKPPSPARNWIPPEIVPKHAPASNYTMKSEVYAVCIVIAEVNGCTFSFLFCLLMEMFIFFSNLIFESVARFAGIAVWRTSGTSHSSHLV